MAAAAHAPKWIEALFTPAEALALLQAEHAVHHGPNDCWLSRRTVQVGEYPRKQLAMEELPAAMDPDDVEGLRARKAARKVSLHALAARARDFDVQAGDVSHRCGRGQRTAEAAHWGCFNPAHVLVEDHARNMRRLNCILVCPHCDEYVCPHGGQLPEGAAARPAPGKTTEHSGCIA